MLCLSLARVVVFDVLAFHLTTALQTVDNQNRLFEVDYEHDQFLKDGSPFRYVSGSLHYFRVRRASWQDRLRKYRAAGLNVITTYVEWRLHEPQPGEYDFAGENDVLHFLDLAQQEDLLVILRPGPYICAERDFGGYPPWLLHENPNMGLRTSDSSHTKYIHSWLSVLLPKLQPYLYGNGGPIIMMQVENEYGSYWACDHEYTSWLRDIFRSYVGDKAVLFTTDGFSSSYLKCGPIPGVFVTVDFGPGQNVTESFKPLREIQPHGPLVNSEFYPGWLTHWGEPLATVSTDSVTESTRELLAANASFNFYMFHGGTNFGFSSGANNPPFAPQITSYDYNAPISEDGNLTQKYYAIKSVISEFMPVPDLPVNQSEPFAYGSVHLQPKVSLFDSDVGVDYGTSLYPRTFEELGQYGGFMSYSTRLPPGYSRSYLEAQETHDRTIVYLNESAVGVLSRTKMSYSLILGGKEGQYLRLLVENQGHINYGNFSDVKGLTKNVTLDGDVLTNWKQTGYPLSNVSSVLNLDSVDQVKLPAFYSGNFDIPSTGGTPQDTFVDVTGWGKGVLWVNGFNLGRYWPVAGPQVTLYLPGSLLRPHNQLLLLELDTEAAVRVVNLVNRPIFINFINSGSRGWIASGVLWVNGFNLGRYWPVAGPQVTLYLPGSLLRPHNQLLLLELDTEAAVRVVNLVNRPIFINSNE